MALVKMGVKSIFVFDWDGTLFDSMSAKTRAFGLVLSNFLTARGRPTSAQDVAAHYRALSGRPRQEIFDLVAANAGLPITELEKDGLSKAIFERNLTGLAEASLFDDTLPCLERLFQAGYRVFISSSVPQSELDYFVDAKLPVKIRRQFAGVLGSSLRFGKGPEHIFHISNGDRDAKDAMLVIGDDFADYALSREAGVQCVLIDRQNKLKAELPTIASLQQIQEFV
jgi:phosphoglycolate phosphatase-like HAD superfamily hydrolase